MLKAIHCPEEGFEAKALLSKCSVFVCYIKDLFPKQSNEIASNEYNYMNQNEYMSFNVWGGEKKESQTRICVKFLNSGLLLRFVKHCQMVKDAPSLQARHALSVLLSQKQNPNIHMCLTLERLLHARTCENPLAYYSMENKLAFWNM